ncbi:MAG: protein translocase subunit SecD [Veillonella sp.]|uniref:protein translocase subunit SecD n=1 Tax=Veillonella sp. TaxID=1926307 RepID=UPI0025D2EFCE|nr:protein translocase subunit SecD [Veillonella sp.]MBS4913932.1 protein translocase subunit SecD [Veillonella sp.]
MNSKAVAKFLAAIAIIIGVFIYFIGPLAESIKQGLDLQGGTHIVLEAEDSGDNKVTDDAVERVIQILSRRINEMGLTEPLIQREGKKRIIIELPGVKDPDEAIKTIGKTAVMEFRDESGTVHLTGNDLKDAKEQITQNKQFEVALEFTDEGADKFAKLTAANIGRHIGIYLDGEQLTNPVVNQAITGGKAVITGSRTLEDAKNLAVLLRSGALPVKVKVMEVRTVGPTLGQDSKDKSVTAFAVGIGLIVAFMLVLYRLSGFVATMALLVYVMILLVVLGPWVLNATLTLPGIAGIILSMGVAVDANILIFERFKEEVFDGKTLRISMESGFRRAFATIFDANTSVMITAIILILLGSGPVKGFAITLALGVIVSMFTAITMSRSLLHLLIECNITNHPFWYGANVSPSATMDLYRKGGAKK